MTTLTAEMQTAFDALRASAEWRALSAQQRVWLTEYLTNGGDPIAAARVAYPDAKAKSQVAMSYQIPKSPALMDALTWWRWRDARNSRVEMIALIRQQIAKAEPGSVAATKLVSMLKTLTQQSADDTEAKLETADSYLIETAAQDQQFSIGDIVVQDGQRYRVTSVDERGRPLTADEVQ
jgi:hypothetical protein